MAHSQSIKFSVGSLLLLAAISNLVVFVIIAAIGLAKGITYPTVPQWFAFGSEFCFYAGLIFAFLSGIGAYFAQKRERTLVSLEVNVFTVMLIAFLTTKG
jgi:hypothetical protein